MPKNNNYEASWELPNKGSVEDGAIAYNIKGEGEAKKVGRMLVRRDKVDSVCRSGQADECMFLSLPIGPKDRRACLKRFFGPENKVSRVVAVENGRAVKEGRVDSGEFNDRVWGVIREYRKDEGFVRGEREHCVNGPPHYTPMPKTK